MSLDLDQYLAALRSYLDAQRSLRAARIELTRYLDETARVGRLVHFNGLEEISQGAAHTVDTVFMNADLWPTAERLQLLFNEAFAAEQRARLAFARMSEGERELVQYPFSSLSAGV